MPTSHFGFDAESAGDRMRALEAFIEHWLGPHLADYGTPVADVESVDLPAPLARFQRFGGHWPGDPWSRHNVLLQPSQIAERPSPGAGLVEFAVENQGVYRWATHAHGEDPPVYCTEYWGEIPPDVDGDRLVRGRFLPSELPGSLDGGRALPRRNAGSCEVVVGGRGVRTKRRG